MSTETMTMKQKTNGNEGRKTRVRNMTMTAMLSAIAFILMFIETPVPMMPSFIKMDLSELPALIGAFSMGPLAGVAICLIKNLLHLFITSTGGVGELANFILGAGFVIPAGYIYKRMNSRKGALVGAITGAAVMAIFSVIANYFIVYPAYTLFMPMEAIIKAYQVILPGADSLLKCLVIFNMPFTFVKGLLCVLISFLIYKQISPFIKGNKKA